jgi:signal transduction histidine kinase
LTTLLAVSLTAVNLLRPIYGPDGAEIVDFTLDYLNPAAQRMAGLPEQPGLTALGRFPNLAANGVFDFYCRTFQSGAPGAFELNYQTDGFDNYFRLAAQRCGAVLVVSFTDTADQPRTPVEQALRESQAREQAAHAEVERQRVELQNLFEQAPVALAVFRGPQYVVELANPEVLRLWGRTRAQSLHTPLFELLPEIADQGFRELLDGVLATGEPCLANEMPSSIDRHGRRDTVYWNFIYQPLRGEDGQIIGVTVVAAEVTDQVQARQQVQLLNEELAAINEELRASNEEFLLTNTALSQTQQLLHTLNQELEARVQERTQALAEALEQTEQQRTELRQQQRQLRQILGQSPAMIATLEGPDHRFAYTNPGYDTLVGHRARLGTPAAECLPEVVDQGFFELLDGVYQTGQPYVGRETPITFQPADGGAPLTYYLDFTYQALVDEHGESTGILAFVVDVTDKVEARRQNETLQAELLAAAQRQAQEREAFYQVFEQTPAAICIQRGPEHRYEYVNVAYQQFFPDRQLLGRTVAEALPETVDAGVVDLLDAVYHTGETYFGYELPLLMAQPDGRPPKQMYFTFTYQAYRENGQIVGISTFAYDVAEQVLARQQRDAQRQQLHDLFMQAPAPIVIFEGPALVFQLVNPAYQLIFPGRELVNKPVLEALPELAGTPILNALQQVYNTGETHTAQEMPLRLARYEGGPLEEIYWTFTYQARRDSLGAVDGVLVFAHEVTDQVQARRVVEEGGQQARALAQDLATANQQLIRTNVDLDNFIYTASHDLKSPITNIEGLLDALHHELPEQPPTSEVAHILELMQDAVNRFKRTIEHLTTVSKLQKEHDAPVEQVALAPIIEDVRLDLAPLLQQTGGRLLVNVQHCPPLLFSAKNLRSVVYNLLSNALKYRHPDRPPVVRVSIRREASFVVLDVQDNGLGIDLAREEYLFAMFQRLHTHVEGSGLGLYMVKRMVENAGGRITVQSQVGEGSTFSVYFPA